MVAVGIAEAINGVSERAESSVGYASTYFFRTCNVATTRCGADSAIGLVIFVPGRLHVFQWLIFLRPGTISDGALNQLFYLGGIALPVLLPTRGFCLIIEF